MPAHGAPSFDLTAVLPNHPPTHIVPAVPLKPSAWIDRVDPALRTPRGKRLACIDAEEVEPRIALAAREFRTDVPTLWKLVSAIRHVLAPEHAEFQHLRRRELGLEVG